MGDTTRSYTEPSCRGEHGDSPLTDDTVAYSPSTAQWDASEKYEEATVLLHDVSRGNAEKSRSRTICSLLKFIIPEIKGIKSNSDLNRNRCLLATLIGVVLNFPKNVAVRTERLIPNQDGVHAFEALVQYVKNEIEAILDDRDFDDLVADLYEETHFMNCPQSPSEVNLGLFRIPALDRVLGPSKSPTRLELDPLVRALRLLAILSVVNENWGVLFCNLTRGHLIDKDRFVSQSLQQHLMTLFKTKKSSCAILLESAASQYPFILSSQSRILANRSRRVRGCSVTIATSTSRRHFVVPRKKVVEHVADNLDLYRLERSNWTFTFADEPGDGEGPTKEFFAEFSKDCQRHDLGLWISDEPVEAPDGTKYASSASGLFPQPRSHLPSTCQQLLSSIGSIMGKSFADSQLMDLNFSGAFYRCLFAEDPLAQQLTLVDVEEVMPSIFGFVSSLVEALRRKRIALTEWGGEESISPDERRKILSVITCDGCPFDDLCMTFTLPGFSFLEMTDGGSSVRLSVDNLEEYLRLLTWWLMFKGPQESFKALRQGFNAFHSSYKIDAGLQPCDVEYLFCGQSTRRWTVEYLNDNCRPAEHLTRETPLVRHLFEVMSTFSTREQRLFLKFVTSSPRLPRGDLACLWPRLTIRRRGGEGDPDLYLPSASTCSNTIFLTDYSSKEILRKKLLLAIEEGNNSFAFV